MKFKINVTSSDGPTEEQLNDFLNYLKQKFKGPKDALIACIAIAASIAKASSKGSVTLRSFLMLCAEGYKASTPDTDSSPKTTPPEVV